MLELLQEIVLCYFVISYYHDAPPKKTTGISYGKTEFKTWKYIFSAKHTLSGHLDTVSLETNKLQENNIFCRWVHFALS